MADIEKIIKCGTPEGIKHLQVDISPVFADPEAFSEACEYMYQMYEREVFDSVLAVDSIGVVFASFLAMKMKKPLHIASHSRNMLMDCDSETVQTHHGESKLYLPKGSLKNGEKIAVVGDMLTFGKDLAAALALVEKQGGKIVKLGMFLENTDFEARKKLFKGIPLESCIITADL